MTQRDYVSRGRAPKPNQKKNKPAARKKHNQKQAPENTVPATLWVRVVVVVLILIGFAAWLWSIKDNAPAPDNQIEQPLVIQDEEGLPELPEEDWQYIKSLPGYEVEVDVEAHQGSGRRYLMQCASFRTRAQAEEMKAKIAFQGQESQIRKSTGENGDWFRVILGPFDTKRDAERARHSLRRASITTCQIWFWNL
ncbi:cell division protein FtsN [Alteromonas sediminis]|uniref:Cell division protein FtsN n=1 Tax=Alteromonas sediminis TaxID=2259342 RepID=A0A3N5Y440_9ALTE|nr:SPOR domain-containing protein [Alteromonas sediminis]RPJ64809.1 cell division protein FtsN [Alteromonas sediminis]